MQVYNITMEDSEVELAKQRFQERRDEEAKAERRRHKPQYGFAYYMPDKE